LVQNVLLIIGLTGGTVDTQQSVLLQLSELFRAKGVVFRLPDHCAGPARLDLLKRNFHPAKIRAGRLALGNLQTDEEITWLRDFGGYLWHIAGGPSAHRIIGTDQMVTPHDTDQGAYTTAENAYSESLLHYREQAQRRLRL
jgi:hypothetical protein